jgi:hypothetical protein
MKNTNTIKGLQDSQAYKAFPITSICRQDLITAGFKTDEVARIDDLDMERIAEKMADAYCNDGFWIDLAIITSNITGLKEPK